MKKPHPSHKEHSQITLLDVAKHAGVSPITVSRVLNDPDKVKAKTQEKVKAAIKEIGYVPNMLAGGLVSSRSKLIVVVVPSIAHRIFVTSIHRITERMTQAGYQVLLSQTFFDTDSEYEQIQKVLSRQPDAVVLTTPLVSEDARALLISRQVPVVEIWDYHDHPIDAMVGFSHVALGQAMAKVMLDKGHQRFSLIWVDDTRGQVRCRACQHYLEHAGATIESVMLIKPPVSVVEGKKAMASLLDEGVQSSAVICSNDLITQGAVACLLERGIQIPEQVALVGFGNIDFTAHVYPSLSTFSVTNEAIGDIASDMLLKRLSGEAAPQTLKHDIGFTFEDRGTS
jgi:LacI family gluconate utilization system Gnt-I transcriptional repressor